MRYDELYNTLKREIPEGYSFFKVKEKEYLIDGTDGMHIVFGIFIFGKYGNMRRCKNNRSFRFHSIRAISG